jgi:Asp-tRNA(Asn)/Glu-tRNA(Gln) amidotransferase A subunit family amidase
MDRAAAPRHPMGNISGVRPMPEIADLTATVAAARIRAGQLDAVSLMEACLERIAAREPTVRAFAAFDADQARAAARTARPGVLHGLPIGVKDVLDTDDYASEYGSEIWTDHRPRADAAAVAWARAAGGVIAGKTVTTEFATRRPGPTTNPANPGHTPGGSSSGSAAGVAAGMFPLAFGTQTGGSVIRPAAFCGIVGYKPSFGTIARQGMKVMSENLDTIGVMARSVADCALFAGAVAGIDLGDPDTRPPSAPRIGLCRSPVWEVAAPETHALMERAATALARAGARVAEQELPDAYAALIEAHPLLMNAESAASMGWEMLRARDRLSEGLRAGLEWGLAQGPAALADARACFARLQTAFPAAMGECDILLTPSAPGEAPAGLESTGNAAFNSLWTSLHVPCVTVPAGTGPNGLPLGIQVVGRIGDDLRVLAWAQWVAAVLEK